MISVSLAYVFNIQPVRRAPNKTFNRLATDILVKGQLISKANFLVLI